MSILIFIILSMITAFVDIALAAVAYSAKEHKREYAPLMVCLIMSAAVAMSYLLSVTSDDYFTMSFMSSLYFSFIDLILVAVFAYATTYTKIDENKHIRFIKIATMFLGLADITVQMINPFKEISIRYIYDPHAIAHWKYDPLFLYDLHLIFSYALVIGTLSVFIIKSRMVPKLFRKRYMIVFYGILSVVALNAVFLMFQSENMLDYSVLFYSIINFVMFYNSYYYSDKKLMDLTRELVIDRFGHSVVLFDYSNSFAMANKEAERIFGESIKLKDEFEVFVKKCNFGSNFGNIDKNQSFQWTTKRENEDVIFRCDYYVLRDDAKKITGRLFVFVDCSLEVDLLTGFNTEASFRKTFIEENKEINYPTGVVICDLNRLTKINHTLGRDKGDEAIRLLADAMREYTPEGTYFARLHDANLLFVSQGIDIKAVRDVTDKIAMRLAATDFYEEDLDVQSAVAMVTGTNMSIMEAVVSAEKSLQAKKLMDQSSSHSSLLDSLAQTLQESDSCTEEHVKRTRIMGERLGRRLGLSDVDLSNLALLCLLHDIGKLGVPLEILNKPSKLDKAEWEVMKSHAEKGYKIAKASKELEGIADLILHHHECWDGSGYPDGLKQEEIPILSRIISVVDTYDAMTNDRPYRRALSPDKACGELVRCAGTQFDPYIVTEFIEMLKEYNLYTQPSADENKDEESVYNPVIAEDYDNNKNLAYVKYTKYILMGDGSNRIISIDNKFEEFTGYSMADVESYKLTQDDLVPPEDCNEYNRLVGHAIGKYKEAYIEHRLRRKDGISKYVFCFGKMFYDSATKEQRVEIITTDLAESSSVRRLLEKERYSQQRVERRWEDGFRKDALTGLLNRVAFQNDVQMELMQEDCRIAMLMSDIDHFKGFNDTHGHLRGDELLKVYANALLEAVSSIGLAARVGGDEFAAMLVFDKSASDQDIRIKVEEIFGYVSAEVSGFDKDTTLSMGVAIASKNTKVFNDLYKESDEALYYVKDNGKNSFVIRNCK